MQSTSDFLLRLRDILVDGIARKELKYLKPSSIDSDGYTYSKVAPFVAIGCYDSMGLAENSPSILVNVNSIRREAKRVVMNVALDLVIWHNGTNSSDVLNRQDADFSCNKAESLLDLMNFVDNVVEIICCENGLIVPADSIETTIYNNDVDAILSGFRIATITFDVAMSENATELNVASDDISKLL